MMGKITSYEIKVFRKYRVYFSVTDNIDNEGKAREVYQDLKKRFPEEEGFNITVIKSETDFEVIKF